MSLNCLTYIRNKKLYIFSANGLSFNYLLKRNFSAFNTSDVISISLLHGRILSFVTFICRRASDVLASFSQGRLVLAKALRRPSTYTEPFTTSTAKNWTGPASIAIINFQSSQGMSVDAYQTYRTSRTTFVRLKVGGPSPRIFEWGYE